MKILKWLATHPTYTLRVWQNGDHSVAEVYRDRGADATGCGMVQATGKTGGEAMQALGTKMAAGVTVWYLPAGKKRQVKFLFR